MHAISQTKAAAHSKIGSSLFCTWHVAGRPSCLTLTVQGCSGTAIAASSFTSHLELLCSPLLYYDIAFDVAGEWSVQSILWGEDILCATGTEHAQSKHVQCVLCLGSSAHIVDTMHTEPFASVSGPCGRGSQSRLGACDVSPSPEKPAQAALQDGLEHHPSMNFVPVELDPLLLMLPSCRSDLSS